MGSTTGTNMQRRVAGWAGGASRFAAYLWDIHTVRLLYVWISQYKITYSHSPCNSDHKDGREAQVSLAGVLVFETEGRNQNIHVV